MNRTLTVATFLISLLLALASPLPAQTSIAPCGAFSASRTYATDKRSYGLTLKSTCLVLTDTVKRVDTVTKTVTVTRVDTVRIVRVDTVKVGTPVEPPKDTVVTPPPAQTAGCSNTDLLCDDFEDGDWYTLDCEAARNTAAGLAGQDGWCGTIYANPITPAKAAVCGGKGAKGTNCAATYGTLSGSQNQRNMADHAFAGGPVNELWARWYYKADAGYQWGAEKHTNFTKSAGDIAFFNIQFNCGTGAAKGTGQPFIQIIHGATTGCYPPTEGAFAFSSGAWYYVEVHANLTAGVVELWANNCGTGTCTGTPTLRTRLTGLKFDLTQSPSRKIEVLWFESWANPTSRGTAYLDQIAARTTGQVGF